MSLSESIGENKIMILLHRKPIDKVLLNEARRLFIASVRMRSAKNMVEEAKRKRMDSVLIATAMVGFPVSSKDLANMNMNAAIKDVEKTIGSLRKIKKRIEKEYPHLYITRLEGLLDETITLLEGIVEEELSVDMALEIIDQAIALIRTIANDIASYRGN